MGLDMYLYARKHQSRLRDDEPDFDYPKGLEELQEGISVRNFKSMTIDCQIGYWRKFNALHNYIVETFAGGKDECQTIYLERGDLEQILEVCEEVRDDHAKAEALLPCAEGFFFGSQEYDEWYFRDLDYTIDLLKKTLKLDFGYDTGFSVFYRASW